MKVSLNTVKQYTTVDLPLDDLLVKINGQLGGVEEVVDLSERYKDARIVRIVACDDHPNADRLHVCKVDDGGQVADVPRDENGLVQVVCGAPNARADIFAVWLPPKSTVPSSFADKEPFVLDARELRGVLSQGMMASPKELGLGDDHDGILEIDPSEWKPNDLEIQPGTSFAEAYGLDDTIIDIENKMFTHRPDLFGQLGVAREIAGIQHIPFSSPDWYRVDPEFNRGEGLALTVKNNAYDNVPRFMAVAIKDVEVKPSPVWLRAELVRLGSKPINNIVDVTNYIMLLTAQPTHAYDYDKLRGHTLEARMARSGEKVTLLNHKTYDLDETDIVIADGEGPVGLAGIMGGGDSEVSNETKNIVLEVANFDMYTVRKSSMRHGVFTDALTRFNKGQSSLQNAFVLNLLMSSIADTAGGVVATTVYDEKDHNKPLDEVSVTKEFINLRLGLGLTIEEIALLLRNVEFDVETSGDELQVRAPFWRTDIQLPEDVVEEVGRLYGFDKLPRELPRRSMKPVAISPKLRAKAKIREAMKRAGANEVLTYSFVHENIFKKSEQDKAEAFQLSNALSPDLQYYRLSVLPSLLDKVHANIKAGHDEFVIYEIGKGHNKKYHADDDEGLPAELEFVDVVYASKKPQEGAAFYKVRRYVEELAAEFGRTIVCKPITEDVQFAVTAPFEVSRSAFVHDGETDEFIGMIGELKPSVVKAFKLPEYISAVTLDMAFFEQITQGRNVAYQPLPKYPSTSQDITVLVTENVTFEQINTEILKCIDETTDKMWQVNVVPVSVYADPSQPGRSLTFRVQASRHDKTLSDAEMSQLVNKIVEKLKTTYQAVLS